MNKVVVKFGGSSLADSNQIKKVESIINEKVERKYVITSAPGKRNKEDEKITDLLIKLDMELKSNVDYTATLEKINDRYISIVSELQIDFNVEEEIYEIINIAKTKTTRDFLISRGEYLSAKILSKYVDGVFLDMANVIIFNDDKKLDYELTYENIKNEISKIEKNNPDKKIIIPGFYGTYKNGEVVTFSRGGSDITGSLIAHAINAKIYENWTDVSGVLFTDPRIVENPNQIEYITYTELRELSYMGASVLHEDAIYPVSEVGIPINILNTNKPTDKGTMIVSNIPTIVRRKHVTGLAGKKGFSTILLSKQLMNEEVGFLYRIFKIFYEENISVEHAPTGIDTVSVILKSEDIKDKELKLMQRLKNELELDNITIDNNIALIAVVGEGMSYSKNVTSDIFDALKENDIQVKMIDQGSSGINVIIGIDENDYEDAIRALYDKLK